MVSVVQNVAVECRDAYALARFWSEATGSPIDPEDGPGDEEIDVLLAGGPSLHFNQVPAPQPPTNALHLCLRPRTTCADEVERLLALGATQVADRRTPDGLGWVVLADPEGHSFCVLRGQAEREAAARAD